MKNQNSKLRIFGAMFIIALLTLFILPDIAEARRGGRSFGGRRSSSRSYSRSKSKPSRTKPSSSFGKKRSTVPPSKRSSFGGTRMNSSKQYTSKYGAPRKTETFKGKNAAGGAQNYQMHHYGGYGSGLMTGYMMGRTSMMWSMPFHPAFYYSRPHYVRNADGSMGVYPPTFSFGKLIFTLIILGVIIFIIRKILQARKQGRNGGNSSFS